MTQTPDGPFYDVRFEPTRMTVRYAIGGQERHAVVLPYGHSLEDHLEGLETNADAGHAYTIFQLADGGQIAIRIDSIVAIEAT